MAIFRINRNKNYTVMSNHHLKDKGLSLKAKGLLSQMLSLPENWDYSIEGLVNINREEKTAVTSALRELKNAGYVVITKHRSTTNGCYEYVYDIYEKPQSPDIGFPALDNPALDNPDMEVPAMENPALENQPQLNTNNKILNNKILNNKLLNSGSRRFTPPTLDEVRAYCEERKNDIDPEAFIDHYTGNGWKVGKNPMKDWKAAVRQWERNEFSSGRKPKQQQMANKSYDIANIEALFASDLEDFVKDGEKNGV